MKFLSLLMYNKACGPGEVNLRVRVFRTMRGLQRARTNRFPEDAGVEIFGTTCGIIMAEPPHAVEILMCEEQFTPALIAHEAFHAAVKVVRFLNGDPYKKLVLDPDGDSTPARGDSAHEVSDVEEQLAYFTQDILNAILKWQACGFDQDRMFAEKT